MQAFSSNKHAIPAILARSRTELQYNVGHKFYCFIFSFNLSVNTTTLAIKWILYGRELVQWRWWGQMPMQVKLLAAWFGRFDKCCDWLHILHSTEAFANIGHKIDDGNKCYIPVGFGVTLNCNHFPHFSAIWPDWQFVLRRKTFSIFAQDHTRDHIFTKITQCFAEYQAYADALTNVAIFIKLFTNSNERLLCIPIPFDIVVIIRLIKKQKKTRKTLIFMKKMQCLIIFLHWTK